MNPDTQGIPTGAIYLSAFPLIDLTLPSKITDHYDEWKKYGFTRTEMMVVYPAMLYIDPLVGRITKDDVEFYFKRINDTSKP